MTYDHENLTMTGGDLAGLRDLLQEQRVRRLDVVTGSGPIKAEHGMLLVDSAEQAITEDGVTSIGGLYRPTKLFDETLAGQFGLRRDTLRFLREQDRLELYDFTVNHFLHGSQDDPQTNKPWGSNMMLRLFTGDETGGGIARVVVSDKFKALDHLDVLVAALNGIREAGVDVDIRRCDLTDTRMYVQVACPQVQALAPELLRGYRSPFTGKSGADNPVLFAGFVISNSETGQAAASITPRVTIQICGNGATFSKDATRMIHIGARQGEGIVSYSEDTQQKALVYAQAKVRDAAATFLDTEYLKRKVREMEHDAGIEIPHPEDTIKQVVQQSGIPMALADDVLGNFIKGGQLTAGGVMQAVTATAQTVDSPDLAYELEDKATLVLANAARLA